MTDQNAAGKNRLRWWCLVLGPAMVFSPLTGSGQSGPASSPAAGTAPLIVHIAHGPNAPEQAAKHTVVLVLLHGFRADFAARYGAKTLLAMAVHGASAPDGMRPSFPPTALPNSYTLATGLYPGHHGIVGESFRSGDGTRLFREDDPQATEDGSWFGGVPLWVLAEQQGMRTACLLWPGSAAEIAGGRPTLYARAGVAMPDDARLKQALAWLRLPEAERPHLLALAVAGIADGPNSPQTRAAVGKAVLETDRLLGSLRAGIAALQLPIDLVVVSDGAAVGPAVEWINLDAYADLSKSRTAGPLIYAEGNAAESDAEAQKVYDSLKIADARFAVYRRANLPKDLHLSGNLRIGDPVVVPTGPFAIRAHAPAAADAGSAPLVYDPRPTPAARTIFYAEGPDVRAGVRLEPFENTNVYPFVAALLGLHPSASDGSVGVLSPALKADQ